MERPNRTPKQHKVLIKRIRKIGRMFKPDGTLFHRECFALLVFLNILIK